MVSKRYISGIHECVRKSYKVPSACWVFIMDTLKAIFHHDFFYVEYIFFANSTNSTLGKPLVTVIHIWCLEEWSFRARNDRFHRCIFDDASKTIVCEKTHYTFFFFKYKYISGIKFHPIIKRHLATFKNGPHHKKYRLHCRSDRIFIVRRTFFRFEFCVTNKYDQTVCGTERKKGRLNPKKKIRLPCRNLTV